MHIAIDARVIHSGTGRYIERLLTYLETLDSPHEFSVIVPSRDADYWKPTKPNFKVVTADYQQYSFAEQLGFALFLKKLGADLVHFCMPQQPLLYRGASVTTVHDLNLLRITENDDMPLPVLKVKQLVFRQLLTTVVKRSKYILAPSDYTKHDILQFCNIPARRIVRTYEAAEKLGDKPEALERFKNVDFIMYLGRAETYKNNRGLIAAHQKLLAEHPELRLIIAGSIDELREKDRAWVKQHNYKNIDFVGFVSDGELAWMYENCKAYVFPSYMEGFGLPGLEAMLHGAPVVSSDATCLPEIYGDAAVYFNPADVNDMAEKILQVLDDKKLQEKLRHKGNEQANKYSWKKMAEQTLEVYNSALR